jgi:hypothetical protein
MRGFARTPAAFSRDIPAMHPIPHSWRGPALAAVVAALTIIAGAGASTSFAQESAPAQTAFRPEIAAPLQAAEELIRAKKFDEALARIRLADAVADRTASESLAIDRMRGIAALGAGDIPTATRSFEAVIAAGRLEPAERARMAEVLAQLHFRARDYAKAATWAAQYLKDGGAAWDALAADRCTTSPTIARARRASCARPSMPT